jgi:peptide/nickel transport system substrate-binding protein
MTQPFSRRDFGAIAMLAAAGGLLPLRHAQAKKADGRMVVAIPADVLTLDPSRDISLGGVSLFGNLYERLTEIQGDGTVIGWLAESWKASDDATVWDFKIRASGPKFHDGTPVTVDDVLWTFNYVLNDSTAPGRPYFGMVNTIEKVGGDTIRFTLKRPFAPFERQASLVCILPKAYYEKVGAAEFARNPVGSGAFKVTKWVRDDVMELAANEGYWRGTPKVKTVVIKPIPAETTRTAALSSGDVDIVALLPPAIVDRLSNNPAVNVVKIPSNRILYVGYNQDVAPYGDLKLRQAMDLCINREAIATRLIRGLGQPMGQMVGPKVFGYDPEIKPLTMDVARAKALVADSGYKGEKLVLQFPQGNFAFGAEMAQAIANNIKSIGVNIDVQPLENAAFYPMWAGNKFQGMYFFSMAPSSFDADVALTNLYGTGSKGYYRSEQLDALLAAQRAEINPEKRKKIISDIWKLSQAQVMYSPILVELHAYGLANGLEWEPRADLISLYRNAAWI